MDMSRYHHEVSDKIASLLTKNINCSDLWLSIGIMKYYDQMRSLSKQKLLGKSKAGKFVVSRHVKCVPSMLCHAGYIKKMQDLL